MLHIRERPPLRHDIEIATPNGRHYRWADDEHRPENIPAGLRHSSTMPGGFETSDCVLPRDPARDYNDLGHFSTMIVRHCGGEIVSETRLERAPRTSGDRMSISPSAVGWQAHLEDDKSASMIYRDIDLGRWGEMSRSRRVTNLTANRNLGSSSVGHDKSGAPVHIQTNTPPWPTAGGIIESLYDAGPGNTIDSIAYAFSAPAPVIHTDAGWNWEVLIHQNEDRTGTSQSSGDLSTAASGSGTFDPATAYRYATLQFFYSLAYAGSNSHEIHWGPIAIYGNHGLTKRGTEPNAGLYASDVVGHAVGRWSPLLKTTSAGESTISPSTFVIPHLPFYDPSTAAEMIKQAIRFELLDWAVWENKTFWMHERGARGRSWRARVGPAQLEETGPQADRVWESIIVSYRDVDGSARTVGPPGSGTDTESADLQDSDTENPATQLGIIRRDLLQMGTSTAAAATEVGRRFLEQAKQLDSSGRARIVGHVEDDRGVLHPYSHVRAGDTITFVDAASPGPRRIVKVDHSHDECTCSVDLDAPPEGLQALLERLGVVLVPLGL